MIHPLVASFNSLGKNGLGGSMLSLPMAMAASLLQAELLRENVSAVYPAPDIALAHQGGCEVEHASISCSQCSVFCATMN